MFDQPDICYLWRLLVLYTQREELELHAEGAQILWSLTITYSEIWTNSIKSSSTLWLMIKTNLVFYSTIWHGFISNINFKELPTKLSQLVGDMRIDWNLRVIPNRFELRTEPELNLLNRFRWFSPKFSRMARTEPWFSSWFSKNASRTELNRTTASLITRDQKPPNPSLRCAYTSSTLIQNG